MHRFLRRYPAFSYPDYTLYWIAQLFSTVGTQMQVVAVGWHIYLLTHSAVALGLTGLFATVPLIIFSFLGGTFADRHDRKVILYITQTVLASLAAILAFTTFHGVIGPAIIFIITAFASVANAFNLPTVQAFVPRLVKQKDITNAMSMNYIMRQIGTVAGPGIAGFVIARFGVGAVYGFNSLSFLVFIVALLCIRTSGKVEKAVTTTHLDAIGEGLHFIRSKMIIWSTMLLDFFCAFFASATSLLPIFAKDILMVGPQGLGLLYAAPSVGSIIAGLLVGRVEQMKKQGRIIIISIVFYAAGTILFGISRTFILSLFALAVVGAGDSISTIIRNTIRQLETPDNIRGRMTSINMIFFMGGPQLGEFEAGLLAAAVGGPLSVVIGGVATLVTVLGSAYLMPKLWNYELKTDSV